MLKCLTVLMAVISTFALIAPSAAAEYQTLGRVPGRVVVTLQPGLAPSVAKAAGGLAIDLPALQAAADRYQARDMSRLYPGFGAPEKAGDPDLRRFWAIDFPEHHDLDEVLAAFAALPEVAKAEAVDICAQYALPNDPNLAQQWYLRNTVLGAKDIRALGGWAETVGDTNIVIAIVDSGVDWMHPDLGGTGPNYLNGAIKINWTEWFGTPGVDDDGNGFVDDWRGWDFVTGVTGEPGQDLNTPDNDPMDFESHGTACAGVAAAMTDNGLGIAGASWGCKILPVRVGWLPAGSEIGVVRMDFCSQGMIYAAARGAKIINCSWGSTSFLSSAVTYCVNQGAIIVTAAGNDNDETSPSYLSTHPNVLSVAATDQNDAKASFSNYGSWVEVAAPGVSMYTTWYNRSTGAHTYASTQGTSFASPLTAGALALIWSANPLWTRTQVINRLLATADNIDAVNPAYAGKLGAGRINLLRALGDSFQKVPVEFPTLFDAMNAATPGDTIALRAADSLSGTQTIANKALYILGGYDPAYASRDPSGNPTVINANPSSPALLFQGGTGPGTVVDGFRCTGGGGQSFGSPIAGFYGGGVVINGTSPSLRNLDVTGNSLGSVSQFGGGGGLFLLNSNATLTNVAVHGNSAIYGAGVYIFQGAPTLIGCRISDNTPVFDNFSYAPRGGGLCIQDANVTLIGCEISGHADLDLGGGVYAANFGGATVLTMRDNEIHGNTAKTKGGGLYMAGNSISMLRDSFHDNGKASTATFMSGGAFQVENAAAVIDSVTSQGNQAHVGAGGAITAAASAVVRNSVLTGNTADFFGGALAFQTVANGQLTGNTVAANSSPTGAAGFYVTGSTVTVERNLMALNTGGTSFANGFHASSSTVTFSCNNAFGNSGAQYGGVADPTGTGGNVALDPLFCNAAAANFGLQDASPCLPAHSGGCGLIGALGAACSATSIRDGELPDGPPLAFRVEQNAPNPFNPATTIRFTLPEAAPTTVRVFDLAGRLVRTLVDAELPAAAHTAVWDGRDGGGRAAASGVYFFQVISGRHAHTGRMALIK